MQKKGHRGGSRIGSGVFQVEKLCDRGVSNSGSIHAKKSSREARRGRQVQQGEERDMGGCCMRQTEDGMIYNMAGAPGMSTRAGRG